MNKSIKILAMLVAITSLSLANASESFYLKPTAGFVSPSDATISGLGLSADLQNDNGYTFGLAAGREFGWGRAEVEVDYTAFDVANVQDTQIEMWSGFVNAIYDIPFKYGNFSPYVGVGAGVTNGTIDVGSVGDASEVAFGYQFIAGIDYQISEDASVGLQYRYRAGQDFEDEGVALEYPKLNIVSAAFTYRW